MSCAPFMATPMPPPIAAAWPVDDMMWPHGSPVFHVLSSSTAPTNADGMPWAAFMTASFIASLTQALTALSDTCSVPFLAAALAASRSASFSAAAMALLSPAVAADMAASTAPTARSTPASSHE